MECGRASYVKLNNKGLSLVELIVAISMGVIVSAGIAALITFSIKMYHNESVNTTMQYELQSNINMMMDEIMGASVMVVQQSSESVTITDPPAAGAGKAYTDYAMFGKLYKPAGATDQKFKGVIFVSSAPTDGNFKVYMDRIDEACPGSYTDITAFAAAKSAISGDRYLLGENLTQFVIIPDPNGRFDTSKNTYTNPIEVRVKLQFEKDGWGTKKYSKHVDDITYLRNKVAEPIYINGTEFKVKKQEE